MTFAAKLCYGKEREEMTDDKRVDLMIKILKSKHFSILEHASACFYITNVSRNFTHQLVRHRHMSFAQQSFHYSLAKDSAAPIHPDASTAQADIMRKQFVDAFSTYERLMQLGMPKEEARHVLPSGTLTRIVATANLREWLQFVCTRTCAVNCHEIRQVALKVRETLAHAYPFMAPYMGPACLTEHKCNEGVKYCGKPWSTLK
jgi:thymidylate synthase (FAD)